MSKEADNSFTIKAVAAFTLLGYATALLSGLEKNMPPEIKIKHDKFLKAIEDTQYKGQRLDFNNL